MTAVTRRYRFSASHRLHAASLTFEQNEQLYGKCNNPYGHGHNYILEVTCEGRVDDRSGQVIPLALLDSLVTEKVLKLVAFRNMNEDMPQFRTLVPTTENMLRVIAALLDQSWADYIPPGVHLSRLHIQETGRNEFELLLSETEYKQTKVNVHA